MKVYGITGLPGSGKSIISDFARDKGACIISMGDVVRKEAESLGCNSEVAAVSLRKKYGDDIFAKLCVEEIRNLTRDMINNQNKLQDEINDDEVTCIIEGIRSPSEVDTFKEKFDNFKVIAIHSSPETRFERLKKRNRRDDTDNFDKFLERDIRELGFGIGNVIATADYIMINDNPLEDELAKMINNYNNKLNLDNE